MHHASVGHVPGSKPSGSAQRHCSKMWIPARSIQFVRYRSPKLNRALPPAVPGLIPYSRSIQPNGITHSLPAPLRCAGPFCRGLVHVHEHARGGYDMPCHVMRARSALSTSHVQGGQVHVVRAGRSRLDGNAWLMPGCEMPGLSPVGKTAVLGGHPCRLKTAVSGWVWMPSRARANLPIARL